MNTITIELCKEDRQRLDEVIAFLGLIAGKQESRPEAVTEATAASRAEETPAPEITHPVEEVAAPVEPEPVAEPVAPKWTKADLQARVQALAAPGTGKREKVRAIVKSYAEKVGDIPEDKYAEVMDKLIALEKEG